MAIDRARNQILFTRVSRLLGVTSKAANEEPVHQLRSTIRRLEAVLQTLLTSSERNRKLSKKLKKIRKRAGRVRDFDVQLNALKTIEIGAKGKHKGRIASTLEKKRHRQAEKLAEQLSGEDLPDLRLQLRQKAALVRAAATAAERKGSRGARPVDTALRMFGRLVKNMPQLNEQNLHEFRTECKHLRYVAEIEGNDPIAKEIAKTLEPLQDAIGEWHDWVLLLEASEEALSAHTNSPLLSAIRNLTVSRLNTAYRVTKEAKAKMLQLARVQAELNERASKTPDAASARSVPNVKNRR